MNDQPRKAIPNLLPNSIKSHNRNTNSTQPEKMTRGAQLVALALRNGQIAGSNQFND